MDKEVKKVFSPSTASSRKLSSYLERLEQDIRLIKCNHSFQDIRLIKCNHSFHEVCVNFIETDTYSSATNRKSFKINIVVITNA